MGDIAKVKLAEEDLLKAWMGTPLVIIFVVQNGVFVSFNNEFARTTGYGGSEVHAIEPSSLVMSDLLRTPKPDLTGRRCSELFQRVSESAAEWLSSLQQWPASCRSFEYQSAGRWFEVTVAPAAQPTPGGYAYVLTIKDTTSSKRLEEQTNARAWLLDTTPRLNQIPHSGTIGKYGFGDRGLRGPGLE
ncbi:MAG: hypothetical protein Q7R39_01020 [Dehalococcoidia bacterium]|nr:hypothetical protein [Dehalococcoidia bacterium]